MVSSAGKDIRSAEVNYDRSSAARKAPSNKSAGTVERTISARSGVGISASISHDPTSIVADDSTS